MPVSNRMKPYLSEGGGAGLVRVEVLIAAGDRPSLLAYAAELRAGHRSARGWSPRLEALYTRAFERFGASCMWNMKPSRSHAGARAVARALRENGGMEAWRLAAEIRREVGDAAR